MEISTTDYVGNSSLTDLPVEILLKILQYLEIRFISNVLSRVNTLFRDIACDNATWKIRIQRRWPGQYPALPPTDCFDWTQACIEREEENKIWKSPGERMLRCTNSTSHYASVDAVLITDDLIVSGSRDRSINLWPLNAEENMRPVSKHPDAHRGWVWNFSCKDDLLLSGAWDSLIKFWKITPAGMTEARAEARLKTAVLTTDICENRVVAGTFDNKVIQLDVREENKKMTFYKSHSKPVLKVKMTPSRIFSLSEDSTLVVHDRTAGKRLKKIELPTSNQTFDNPNKSFPLSMDMLGNMIYIGDSTGSLHLLDTTNDLFDVMETYSTGHTGRITSVVCGYGSYITSCSDGSVRVYQPTRKLDLLSKVPVDECGQITSMGYKDNLLAIGGSSNTICVWRKRDDFASY